MLQQFWLQWKTCSVLFFLLPLFFLSGCKNPYVVDASGVEVEETGMHHESFDDSCSDDYLSKPMVNEVDANGVSTTDPADDDRVWIDRPDSYDKGLFRSPAMSTMDEGDRDAESSEESADDDGP
jgi:hypothetical protein